MHGRVLLLRLGPSSPDHILGWRIASSTPDAVQAVAEGPLGSGVLVGRKTADTVVLTTYITYRRPASRVVWAIVMPVHRRVAPYLLARAARRA